MPPILAERRKKLATFVPQAEALLMTSVGRTGPGVRLGQRGSRTFCSAQTVLANPVCLRDLILFPTWFCSAAEEVSWVNCLASLSQT